MIDIENQIITLVQTALTGAEYPIDVLSDKANAPKSFPACYVVESDSYDDRTTADSSSKENCVNVTYEVELYTEGQGRKSQAKEIFSVINDTLVRVGFSRVMRTTLPNADASLYRLFARYTAKVSKNETIYGR